MKAIVTKYIGATDTKPSNIKASAECVKSITVSYDHSLDSEDNHRKAAKALAESLQWGWKQFVSGGLPNGDYAHVQIVK